MSDLHKMQINRLQMHAFKWGWTSLAHDRVYKDITKGKFETMQDLDKHLEKESNA